MLVDASYFYAFPTHAKFSLISQFLQLALCSTSCQMFITLYTISSPSASCRYGCAEMPKLLATTYVCTVLCDTSVSNDSFLLTSFLAREQTNGLWHLTAGFLNDTHLIGGSVIGTTLKYVYIFCLLRVTYAILWIHLISVCKTL